MIDARMPKKKEPKIKGKLINPINPLHKLIISSIPKDAVDMLIMMTRTERRAWLANFKRMHKKTYK